jgi:HSP20 family protein
MANLIPWGRGRGRRGELTGARTHPLAQLQDQFDALWDRFLSGWPMPMEDEFGPQRFWDLDVEEGDKEVIVRAEVPGFEPNDLDIEVNNGVLTIKAEKKQETKEGEGAGGRERRYAIYRRSMTLPPGTNPDKAEANYRNGVLELHIPKTAEAQAKRIPIQGQGRTQGAIPSQAATPQTKGGERQSTTGASTTRSGSKQQ